MKTSRRTFFKMLTGIALVGYAGILERGFVHLPRRMEMHLGSRTGKTQRMIDAILKSGPPYNVTVMARKGSNIKELLTAKGIDATVVEA